MTTSVQNQSLSWPTNVQATLDLYPDIRDIIQSVDKMPIVLANAPESIVIYFDGLLAVQWDFGNLVFERQNLPPDFRPDVIEWWINGQLSFVLVHDFVALNRLEDESVLNSFSSDANPVANG